MTTGDSGAEPLWTKFLRRPHHRGPRDVDSRIRSAEVVSDAHDGPNAAVKKVLNATWQR